MKYLITLGVPILLCIVAAGTEKPAWTSHAPSDTAKTLFFVGRSAKVESEAEGLRMASKDAREQLLRQEFGTTVKVDTTQTETLKDVSLNSQLSEISDLILLKGFKQTDVYAEKEKDTVEVWALFSVPRSEIKQEKERVQALQKQKAKFTATDTTKVTVEAPSTEFNNGGKPKLRKGMKKSQVIGLFGTPVKVETAIFHYTSSEFCEGNDSFTGKYYNCTIWFTENGRVNFWSRFLPGYTSDLDDEPVKKNKRAVTTSGFDPDAFLAQTTISQAQATVSHKRVSSNRLGYKVKSKKNPVFISNDLNTGILSYSFFVKNKSNLKFNYRFNDTNIFVKNDDNFGIKIEFESVLPNQELVLYLKVPSKPEHFNCHSCNSTEFKILKEENAVLLKRHIDSKVGSAGFSWWISAGDPRGIYQLYVELGGISLGTVEFHVD